MAALIRSFFRYFSHGNLRCGKDTVKPAGHANLYRFLTLGIALPTVVLLSLYNFTRNRDQEELPEFVPYEYLNIRTKRWPWGDGNTPLFYNPKKNHIPTSLFGGYEVNDNGDSKDDGDSNDAEDSSDAGVLGMEGNTSAESTENRDDSFMKKCEEMLKAKDSQSQIKAETEDKCPCGESEKK